MKKNNTMELWHGTCVSQLEAILPTAFCLGNMFETPQSVAYYWRTWEEAAIWSVFKMMTYLEEYLEEPDANVRLFKEIGFEPIPDFLSPEDVIPMQYAWDPSKGKIIVVDNPWNRECIHNMCVYCNINTPKTLQYKVEVDKKKVGCGQTSTIKEYTLNKPAYWSKVNLQQVEADTLLAAIEWVSEEYYELHEERRYAALFNRGLKSFIYTNELVYNVMTNEEKFVKTRHECQNRDKAFVKKYLKDNKGCIEHLYPIKRIKLYMEAKRKLKAVQ